VISVICDRPFLYYIGDAENEDIAFFGVVNQITDDMAVTPEEAGISN
jgi:serine protease inhibitor